jgi:MEDS: MEthanogen/methylotroph, DcmR Sensory domain
LTRLTDFVKQGLEAKETVFVIATEAHRIELNTILMAEHVIGPSASTDGHYVPLDASELLSVFMDHGWPNKRLFFDAMASLIGSRPKGTVVRIYGEMVAVLVANGNDLAAIQLERLWKKFLVRTGDCLLLCAYDKLEFQVASRHFVLDQICACHDTTVGRPSYAVPNE